MKIKEDFVTNSSSTSFTFIFKGDKLKNLFAAMKNHACFFCLSYDMPWIEPPKYINVTLDNIIDAIKSVKKNNDIETIDNIIDRENNSIKDCKQCMDRDRNTGRHYSHWMTYILKHEARITTLKTAKQFGFENVLVVGFGDNHGDISGGDIGNAMDYEGRNISIIESDLIVYTEQNR